MAKAVLRKEEADKIAISFQPQKFPHVITETAKGFHALNAQSDEAGRPSFRIDRLVAEQTGVAELERLSIEEKVEREALLRVKEFQEAAYQEAYQLGLDEGRERALHERSVELGEKMRHLDELLRSFESVKTDLIACNETQIVRLVYYMAKRLTFREIGVRPEIVLDAVREALLSAQSDENVTVRLATSDLRFIESIKDKFGKEFEALKRAKLDSSDEISPGGCVVETNFGDVNATLEQRLERLWSSVAEKLPKVETVMSAGPDDDSSNTPGEGI